MLCESADHLTCIFLYGISMSAIEFICYAVRMESILDDCIVNEVLNPYVRFKVCGTFMFSDEHDYVFSLVVFFDEGHLECRFLIVPSS